MNRDDHKHGRELGKGRENKRINGVTGARMHFRADNPNRWLGRTFLLFLRGFVIKCTKTTNPSREWEVKINFPEKEASLSSYLAGMAWLASSTLQPIKKRGGVLDPTDTNFVGTYVMHDEVDVTPN